MPPCSSSTARGRARDHQTPGLEAAREMSSEGVGVDIEQRSVDVHPDAGDNRHEAVRDQRSEKFRPRVGGRDTDAAEVDAPAIDGDMRRRQGRKPGAIVSAGQTDRAHASCGQRGDQPGVHESREHPDHDVERRLVGDAQTFDLVLFDCGGLERRVNLAASAVHEHKTEIWLGCSRRGNRRDDCGKRRRLLDQLAAELDHNRRWSAHSNPVSSGRPNMTFTFCTA